MLATAPSNPPPGSPMFLVRPSVPVAAAEATTKGKKAAAKKNAKPPSTSTTTVVLEDDNGKEPTARGPNFSTQDDEQIARSWLAISQDATEGTDQKANDFWGRVHEHCGQYRRQLLTRKPDSIRQRWKNSINKFTSNFVGCMEEARRNASSGQVEEDIENDAIDLFCAKNKVPKTRQPGLSPDETDISRIRPPGKKAAASIQSQEASEEKGLKKLEDLQLVQDSAFASALTDISSVGRARFELMMRKEEREEREEALRREREKREAAEKREREEREIMMMDLTKMDRLSADYFRLKKRKILKQAKQQMGPMSSSPEQHRRNREDHRSPSPTDDEDNATAV
ncbi:hypothetical protein HDU96_005144 [Phlyctochytrium bullatum]|nr:hypothetical protein HDU96_005144 [Phlyctochytrium bullatum]